MRQKTQPACRKCGEPILFLPLVRKSGLKAGLAYWAPHNLDRTVHFDRCKEILQKRQAARRWGGEPTLQESSKSAAPAEKPSEAKPRGRFVRST